MASNSNLESSENQNESVVDFSEYSFEQILNLINEALCFSNSLSIALQSTPDLSVSELQASIVIDNLRIALFGTEAWLNKKDKSNQSITNNDEL